MGKIYWIASFPKSGNTWVRAFLANLLLADDEPLPLNQIALGCQSEAIQQWYTPLLANPNTDPGRLSKKRIMRLRPSAQRRITEVNDNDVFIKTHNTFGHYLGYPLIRSDVTMGALYIVRDPRDVVVSLADHLGLSIDGALRAISDPEFTLEGGRFGMVFERVTSWSNHVASWTQARMENRLVLRYEDLLKDPITPFSKLASRLHLTDDQARVQQVVEWIRFNRVQQREALEGFHERSPQANRFFRSGTAGCWRRVLSSDQAARIERTHGHVMRNLGYL